MISERGAGGPAEQTHRDADTLRAVEQFLFREARLADEHDYDGWEALWTDDGVYHVPAADADGDPRATMSIIYDTRHRIATRIAQLKSGKRHSQAPPSRLRRLVANVELLGETDDGDLLVGANVLIFESRERGTVQWAGRCEYRLRSVDGELRMARKRVDLVDRERALYTLSFLV